MNLREQRAEYERVWGEEQKGGCYNYISKIKVIFKKERSTGKFFQRTMETRTEQWDCRIQSKQREGRKDSTGWKEREVGTACSPGSGECTECSTRNERSTGREHSQQHPSDRGKLGRPLTCLPTLVLRASEQEMQLSFHVSYPWFEFNKGQVTDYTDNNFSSSFSQLRNIKINIFINITFKTILNYFCWKYTHK